MSRAQTLSETMAELRRKLRVPFRVLYDDLMARLTEAATAEGALKEGDAFPEFALPDADGKFVLSSNLLKSGPLVVTFYRGQWCPFCAATMEAMSAAAPAISAAGATAIGISPELGQTSLSANRKSALNFKMLSDVDNGLALQCGLLFRLTDEIVREYDAQGPDLAKTYGNKSCFLPIPATYIVLPNGIIGRAYVNPDFRYRMEPQDILRSLASLARAPSKA
jgi:peroxiredoxin